jgi:hypothetical protein
LQINNKTLCKIPPSIVIQLDSELQREVFERFGK